MVDTEEALEWMELIESLTFKVVFEEESRVGEEAEELTISLGTTMVCVEPTSIPLEMLFLILDSFFKSALIGSKNLFQAWTNWELSIWTFQSRSINSCLSIKLTSSLLKRPSVYFAQCLFFGDESLKFFDEMIRHARKILCLVQGKPLASFGSFFFNLFM